MKHALIFLSFLCLNLPLQAETILLKTGNKIKGKILEQTNTQIKIDFRGVILTYDMDDIVGIDITEIEDSQLNDRQPPDKNIIITYCTNGKLLSEVPLNGNGIERNYSCNGKLTRERSLLNGKTHGAYRSYYASGRPKSTSHWRNGKRNGTFKEYNSNGHISSEGRHKNGLAHGTHRKYFADGRLHSEYFWKHGILIITKTYDINGNVVEEKQW